MQIPVSIIFLLATVVYPYDSFAKDKVLIVDDEDTSPPIKIGGTNEPVQRPSRERKAQDQNRERKTPEAEQIKIRVIESDAKPLNCAESPIVRRINDNGIASSRCFQIAENGTVTFNQLSKRRLSLERKEGSIRLFCKNSNGKRTAYIFDFDDKKKLTLVSGPGSVLYLEYDEAGNCFDISNTTQRVRDRPAILIPTTPTGTAK